MSQLGHSRPKWTVRDMSGLPPIATELPTSLEVRFVPQAEAVSQNAAIGAIWERMLIRSLSATGRRLGQRAKNSLFAFAGDLTRVCLQKSCTFLIY